MLIVTGSVTARPETLAELTAVGIEHVERSLKEDGCIYHSVQADSRNPLRLFFYEQWRDMAALQAHFRVPESGAFVARVRELAADGDGIQLYEATALPSPF